jgi:hypothetical protein
LRTTRPSNSLGNDGKGMTHPSLDGQKIVTAPQWFAPRLHFRQLRRMLDRNFRSHSYGLVAANIFS